jgi:hypothetical protein
MLLAPGNGGSDPQEPDDTHDGSGSPFEQYFGSFSSPHQDDPKPKRRRKSPQQDDAIGDPEILRECVSLKQADRKTRMEAWRGLARHGAEIVRRDPSRKQAVVDGLIYVADPYRNFGLSADQLLQELDAVFRAGGLNAPEPLSKKLNGGDHPCPAGWCAVYNHVVKAPRMLVKGLLPYEGIAFIGGQSGAGKTFIASDAAIALASYSLANPTFFFGRPIKERVGVAVIAAEGSESLGNRLVAGSLNRGVDIRELPVVWRGGGPDLKTEKQLDALAKELRGIDGYLLAKFGVRLGVVILDTLVATFDLEDEDDNSEAAKTIRKMRAIGEKIRVLMVPVHHYGKTPAAGLRGGSGWRAGADVILSVVATRDQSDKVTGRQLNIAKSRDGIEGPVAPFSLDFFKLGVDEDGDDFGSLVVNPRFEDGLISGAAIRARRESKGQLAFRDAFTEALDAKGQTIRVRGDGPAVRAVRLEDVQHQFNQRYAVADDGKGKSTRQLANAQLQAFKRALNSFGREFPTWVHEGVAQWIWKARDAGEITTKDTGNDDISDI